MRVTLLVVAIAGTLLNFSACKTAPPPKQRPISVAVAVTPVGADAVSAAQVLQIHRALRPEIESAGYVLADPNAPADLVLTVSFTSVPGGASGRIKLISLEPAGEFRRATEGAETDEAKRFRRLERELQSIVEAQGRNPEFR